MLPQPLDPGYYQKKVRQIRKHVAAVLTERGLLPKFASWRLTQDPDTGLVVLFGSLHEKYIATKTPTASAAYFDPLLLLELATDLQVQVIPSNTQGLRYAFILHRGRLDKEIAPTGLPALKPEQPLAEDADLQDPIILVRAGHVTAASPAEMLPRPPWQPQHGDSLLMLLGRLAQTTGSFIGVGRPMGMAQVISTPR